MPSSPRVGEVIGLAVIGDDRGCLLHFEMQASKGSGRIISLGSMQKAMKESVAAAAAQFIKTHAKDVGLPNDWQGNYDIAVLATMMGVPKEGPCVPIAPARQGDFVFAASLSYCNVGYSESLGDFDDRCAPYERVQIVPTDGEESAALSRGDADGHGFPDNTVRCIFAFFSSRRR